MTDPTVQAARQILDDEFVAMREALDGITLEGLGWRPPAPDSNTIAILVVHAMHSTRWWLSIATGASLPERDRPSEFLAEASAADELRTFFDELAGDCQDLLDRAASFDAGIARTAPPSSRGGRSGASETVTAAWALLHALEHLREHVAQAQLTRQLWEARAPGSDER